MNPSTVEARRLETITAQKQGQALPYQTPPQPPAYVPPAWATQQPTASATPAEAYGLSDIETGRFNELKAGATATVPTVDQIFQNKQKQYQAEIDAVNKIFGNKLIEANRAGMNRIGGASARQGRSGTAGSDFGAAEDARVGDYNNEVVDGINSEKLLKIQTILGNARKDAESELASKKEARDNDYNKYVEILNTSASRKKEAVANTAKALLAGGASIEDLKNINFEAQYPGLKGADIISSFEELSKTAKKDALSLKKEELGMDKIKSDIAKANDFELSPGQTRYTVDPVTGKTKILASAPKLPTGKSSSNSTTIPSSKPVIKSGALALTGDQFSKLQQGVNALRGTDGFLAPEVYKDLYEDWTTTKGGKEGDFLNTFPPERYVNPAAMELPGFLQNSKGRKKVVAEEDEA